MSNPKKGAPQTSILRSDVLDMNTLERGLEELLVKKLQDLKYEYRPDIRDRASLERNFREKFEALNSVRLTDSEFTRLLDEIVTPDVFTAARTLRERSSLTRDDGTPLALATLSRLRRSNDSTRRYEPLGISPSAVARKKTA